MRTRNGIILFFSESVNSLLTMIAGFLIARMLPVAEFGHFTAALSFASIVAIAVDSGMGMLAAKEVARQTPEHREQLDQLYSWRLRVIALACLVAPLIGFAVLPKGPARMILWGLLPGVLLISVADFFCWIFKGAQRAEWSAVLKISTGVVLLMTCLLAVFSPRPLVFLAVAYFVTGAALTLIGRVVLARAMHLLHWVRLPQTFYKQTLPNIYKLGAILILSVAFSRIDVMMVARILGDVPAGLYAAAARIVDAIRLVPMVVYSIYLPAFSALHDQAGALRSAFSGAYGFMFLFGSAIAAVGSYFAYPLLVTVLGERYGGAAGCFRPLVWTSVLLCTNIVMFALLYSRGDHRTPLIGISAAIIIQFVLNVIWLPQYGITGAGWARLIAEIVNAGVLATGIWRSRIFSLARRSAEVSVSA